MTPLTDEEEALHQALQENPGGVVAVDANGGLRVIPREQLAGLAAFTAAESLMTTTIEREKLEPAAFQVLPLPEPMDGRPLSHRGLAPATFPVGPEGKGLALSANLLLASVIALGNPPDVYAKKLHRYSSKLRNAYCPCGRRDDAGRLLKGRDCCYSEG